jgi:hypothetical protein
MPVCWCTNEVHIAPTELAAGVAFTSAASGGAFSAWQEVMASAPVDLVGVGVSVWTKGSVWAEWEVGVGAVGAEVTIAKYRDAPLYVSSTYGDPEPARPLSPVIGVDAVPAGSRVAIRVRTGNANKACVASWLYMRKPLIGTMLTTSTLGAAAAAYNAVSAGSGAWTWGAWVEVSAPAETPRTICGWVTGVNGNQPGEFEVEYGAGSAGAETPLVLLSLYESGYSGSYGGWHRLANPCALPTNTRVAARYRTAGGNTNSKCATGYVYAPEAL